MIALFADVVPRAPAASSDRLALLVAAVVLLGWLLCVVVERRGGVR